MPSLLGRSCEYPAGVSVDENAASATEEYGYLIVQVSAKSGGNTLAARASCPAAPPPRRPAARCRLCYPPLRLTH